MNLDEFDEKKFEFQSNKDSNIKNSTLSLHIEAYENAVESRIADNSMENESKKNKFIKTWKNIKSAMVGSAAPTTEELFEIPRQQPPKTMTPEVMQFKASQKLLNQSQIHFLEKQQKLDRLIEIVDVLSQLFVNKEIDEEEFKRRLNARHVELGYSENGTFKAWHLHVGHVKKRFIANNGVFENDVDKRIAIIHRRFKPTFCHPLPANVHAQEGLKRFIANNGVFENDVDERIAKIHRRFEPTFCHPLSANVHAQEGPETLNIRRLSARLPSKNTRKSENGALLSNREPMISSHHMNQKSRTSHQSVGELDFDNDFAASNGDQINRQQSLRFEPYDQHLTANRRHS
uniref:Uncharacterized protein n=1 Tax=Panagrolaimus sp. ES5 TaxID=591445 RepID=A0AC34FYL6_9BILA